MKGIADSSVSKNADKIKQQFHALLVKANKEDPRPADVKALSELLYKNKDMKLWQAIMGMGALAEHMATEGHPDSGAGIAGVLETKARGHKVGLRHRKRIAA